MPRITLPYRKLEKRYPIGLKTMTLSAGVGTDVERQLAVQGDGLVVGSGFSVYAAATNLEVRGGFETSTTGWGPSAGTTLTRITTDYKFGAACCEVITDGSAGGLGAYHDTAAKIVVTGSTAYTVSVFAKSISGSTTLLIGVDWYTALDVYVSTSSFTPTMTADWARYSLAMTSPLTGLRAVSFARVSPAVAATYRVDGEQFETGDVATPYIETDGATANRVAGRIQIASAGLCTAAQGAIFARLRMGWDSTANPVGNATVFCTGSAGTAIICSRWDVNQFSVLKNSTPNAIATFSHALGGDKSIGSRWSATQVAISVDGATEITAANSNTGTLDATIDLGEAEAFIADRHIRSTLRYALIMKGVPTDADWAIMHGWGNTAPTFDQIKQLSPNSKSTGLFNGKDANFITLPAFFEG